MKKLLMPLAVLAIGTTTLTASNSILDLKANNSMMDQTPDFEGRMWYKITVTGVYSQNFGIISQYTAHTEVKYLSSAELDIRKEDLKSQYPDNLFNGTGYRYFVTSEWTLRPR
jgi:hypothetical protein